MITPLLLTATLLADTLRLGPGIHAGPLVLTRRTVVLGEPGAILRGGPAGGSVLVIRAAGSVVRGVRIERSGRNPDRYDAGVLVAADSVTLEDLVIRDVLFGVYLDQVRGGTLRRLDIAGRPGVTESERGDGITFYYSRGVLAEHNRISAVRDGIYFSYSDSIQVTGNRISHVRFGLHYMFSHANRFTQNVFTDNAAGAVIMNSRGVAVSDNVFAWNAGSRSYGLVLQQATDPVVTGNLLVGNGIGVFFDNVIRGTVTGNVVAGNWLGMQLFANSEATRLTGNALTGNTFDATGEAGAGTSFTLCVEGRGNYWDAAKTRGYDLDGDGVLDASHAATSPIAELAQKRAGLRLFLSSPAARVFEWAERAMPVFDIGGVTDPCPLAAPPQPLMLTALPPAPVATAGGAGGTGGQQAAVIGVGGALVVIGLAGGIIGRRRRA